MINLADAIFYVKYALCILIIIGILMAPAYIARKNGKGKPDMHAVRIASWVFGWSVIGWLWSLYWAVRK